MQELAPLLDYFADSSVAAWLAGSADLREAVRVTHLLSAVLFAGAQVMLDLRLIGLWQRVPLEDLRRVLGGMSWWMLAICVTSGLALFSQRPFAHSSDQAFQAKMVILALFLLNAVLLRFVPAWRFLAEVDSRGTISRFRTAGIVSLALLAMLFVVMRWPGLL
uniref:hypothetical protein n=1 Tax=Stappia sp. TaxID=1870903 RepID=UPI003BA8F9C2